MRWSRVFLKGHRDHQGASGRPSVLSSRGLGRAQVGGSPRQSRHRGPGAARSL